MTDIKQEKYILDHGIHRGTLMSRDSGRPEEFETYEKAYQAFLDHKKFYRTIGYMIWFASITAPDGTKTHLESNYYVS